MTAVAHLAAHPELPRPTLRICFTPDEEIGEGATLFDVERFGAVCAYTLDGSDLGELQDETFAAEEVIAHDPRRRRAPGLGQGRARQRRRGSRPRSSPRCRPSSRRSAPRAATGFIHVYELERRLGRAVGARRSCATSTTRSSHAHTALLRAHRRGGRRPLPGRARSRSRSRRSTRTCAATSRTFPQAVTARRGGDPRRGHRAHPHADPRRHGRLTPERDGPADAEPVHGWPRLPLAAGVGVGAGDGRGGGDGGAAGGGVGSRWSATPAMTSAIPTRVAHATAPG